ncbi:MAG: hypothetical protein HOM55_07735 [Proteobacteria bacterium]|nr:hypothetical protein [Pseudomonadota bacterium]
MTALVWVVAVETQELDQAALSIVEPIAEPIAEQSSQDELSQESDTQITVNQTIENVREADMWAAQEAYDRGRRSLASALFPETESTLHEALKNAPENTALKEKIERSLYLELPISAANHLVSSGKIEQAKGLLEKAVVIAHSYPAYVEQLQAVQNELLTAGVFKINRDVREVVVDGEGVIDSVYQKMIEYRQLNGSYPSNRRALDRWLPDGRSPLQYFRISYYRPILGGYSLVIQNKTNPEQTLRIDATGMLQ